MMNRRSGNGASSQCVPPPSRHAASGSVRPGLPSRRAASAGGLAKRILPRSSRRAAARSCSLVALAAYLAACFACALLHVWIFPRRHGNLAAAGGPFGAERSYRRMLLGGLRQQHSISTSTSFRPVPRYARKKVFSKMRFDGPNAHVALKHLLDLGWTRTHDVNQAEVIWQPSCCPDWEALLPWQRVSYAYNETAISNKGTLLDYLTPDRDGFPDFDCVPETYRLWVGSERARFFESIGQRDEEEDADADADVAAPENDWALFRFLPSFGRNQGKKVGLWAVKIPHIDGGKGVSFLSTEEELEELRRTSMRRSKDRRIVQRYIDNPLLTEEGNKLDLRVYWFVASTNPPILFVRPDVTMRISISKYQPGRLDLTNEQQNKYKEKWDELRESSRGTSAHLEELLRGRYPHRFEGGADPLRDISCRIQRALAEVYARSYPAVGVRGSPTENSFSLLGADFLIDDTLRPWLIEMQSGPGLPTSSEIAKRTANEMVPEMIDIFLEITEKQRAGSPVFPLESVRSFQLIVNGTRVAEKFPNFDGAQLLSEGAVLPSCSDDDATNLHPRDMEYEHNENSVEAKE